MKTNKTKLEEIEIEMEKLNDEIKKLKQQKFSELLKINSVYIGKCYNKGNYFVKVLGLDYCGRLETIEIDVDNCFGEEDELEINQEYSYGDYVDMNEFMNSGYKEITGEELKKQVIEKLTKAFEINLKTFEKKFGV